MKWLAFILLAFCLFLPACTTISASGRRVRRPTGVSRSSGSSDDTGSECVGACIELLANGCLEMTFTNLCESSSGGSCDDDNDNEPERASSGKKAVKTKMTVYEVEEIVGTKYKPLKIESIKFEKEYEKFKNVWVARVQLPHLKHTRTDGKSGQAAVIIIADATGETLEVTVHGNWRTR